jgi:hypothetical protein
MIITRATTVRLLAATAAAAGLAATAGCSPSLPGASVKPAATVTVTATAAPRPVSPHSAAPASTSASASTAVAASTPTPPAQAPSPTTSAAVPTLGRLAGDFAHGTGFGQARPAKVFNGGDPTGLVSGVTWASWGGATATGTGTSEYVGSGQSVASGREEPATIVAFDLGRCGGTLMYRAVEWYFPQHGQAFSASQYEDICSGSYVGAP